MLLEDLLLPELLEDLLPEDLLPPPNSPWPPWSTNPWPGSKLCFGAVTLSKVSVALSVCFFILSISDNMLLELWSNWVINCSVLVGHQRRFNPIVLKTKEIIHEKSIGKVVGLSGIWALKKDDDYFLPEWRKEISAGPVITNLIHDIDYLRFIFGEITEVSAFSSNNINNFEKEDILSANLKFEQGLIGNFLISDSGTSPWSWETGMGENIHLPYLKENNLRIVGTQGSLEFPNLKLWSYKNGGDNWKSELESLNYDFDEVDPYISQINHFIDVINKKVDPITNASDAKRTLKVALSILESAKLNSIIKI